MGLIPAGAYRNREFREAMTRFSETVPGPLQSVLVDPQTSGGLLMSVAAGQAADLVSALKDAGIEAAADIGKIVADAEELIRVV